MKGSILDLAGIILLLAGMVIGGFLVFKFYTAFEEKYSEMPLSETEQKILQKGETFYNVLIGAIPFVIIGSGIGAIVLAFLIPAHPIFLPISIIALGMFVFLSVVFSNILWEFLNSAVIIDIANKFPLLVSVVQYMPYIIGVIGTILIIVMYSKSGSYE
jgi:hypothetical protein